MTTTGRRETTSENVLELTLDDDEEPNSIKTAIILIANAWPSCDRPNEREYEILLECSQFMKRLLKDQLSTNGFTSEMDNNPLLPLPVEPCIPNHDMFSMARKQHMSKKPLKKTIA